MSDSFLSLPIATIEKALAIRKEIEALQASVDKLLGGGDEVSSPAPVVKDGRKGRRSSSTIAKMKAAAKARWAMKQGATPTAAKPVKAGKTKRFVSPEARAKMAAAQKARWAKKIGASTTPTPATSAAKTPKKRKTMSPEARAKIAAAQKARWAKQKAA